MQKNKYKYVSVGAMVAVMLLLGLYMWMTYLSAVRDISERAGNQSVCRNCVATSP